MDKNEIVQILNDWNFWNKEQKTGILRPDYLSKLKSMFSSVITGPRRAGKSFIMRQMAKHLIDTGYSPKNILIVNFEDPRFTESGVSLLEKIFKTYLEYIAPSGLPILFLDEIQEIENFEKWVRMMHELSKAKIIISGSNAKLLSRELSTLLTGRHLDITVFPLSFNEFLSFNNIKINDENDLAIKDTEIKGLLRKYIEFGSFPEVVLSEQKKEILLTYFEDVITKDLLKRYKIRKPQELRSVIKYYLSNISSLSTMKAIERSLEISITSVKNYTSYAEEAFLIFPLKRFSFKIKEQEKSPRKIYSIDPGLSNAVGFRFFEKLGKLAENIVFLSLLRKQAVNPDIEIFYWKDVHHREVDFIVKEKIKIKRLIQVCWNMHVEKTRKREVSSLHKAIRELDVDNAMIITEDSEKTERFKDKKIQVISLARWLLVEEGIDF